MTQQLYVYCLLKTAKVTVIEGDASPPVTGTHSPLLCSGKASCPLLQPLEIIAGGGKISLAC